MAKSKKKSVAFSLVTEEEKKLARKVWMQVENNYVVISKNLFSELFRKHPEYKNFFTYLIPNKENDDAWKNPAFEKHMIQILMPSLGCIIRSLDNPDAITKEMIRLGKVHKDKKIGLEREHVETLKGVFIETLQNFLGPSIFHTYEPALIKVLTAALNIFEEQL